MLHEVGGALDGLGPNDTRIRIFDQRQNACDAQCLSRCLARPGADARPFSAVPLVRLDRVMHGDPDSLCLGRQGQHPRLQFIGGASSQDRFALQQCRYVLAVPREVGIRGEIDFDVGTVANV